MGPLTNVALFAGACGLEQGARIVGGFRTVCYVERDEYAQAVIMSRIRSGDLDDAPIWDDVTTFDGRPWRGLVDVISGGFPCQDLSVAGKREGIDGGGRSGLWREYARLVAEIRPRFVLVENVPGLLARGQLGIVLGDLAALGFDAEWCVRSAADVGAPHLRERVWVVAHRQVDTSRSDADGIRSHRASEHERHPELRDEQGRDARSLGQDVADAEGQRERPGLRPDEPGGQRRRRSSDGGRARAQGDVPDASSGGQPVRGRPQGQGRHAACPGQEMGEPGGAGLPQRQGQEGERTLTTAAGASWWATEPNVGRVAHGMAFRVDRLRLCGNGVVPQQAAPAWARIKALAAAQDLAVKDIR